MLYSILRLLAANLSANRFIHLIGAYRNTPSFILAGAALRMQERPFAASRRDTTMPAVPLNANAHGQYIFDAVISTSFLHF